MDDVNFNEMGSQIFDDIKGRYKEISEHNIEYSTKKQKLQEILNDRGFQEILEKILEQIRSIPPTDDFYEVDGQRINLDLEVINSIVSTGYNIDEALNSFLINYINEDNESYDKFNELNEKVGLDTLTICDSRKNKK